MLGYEFSLYCVAGVAIHVPKEISSGGISYKVSKVMIMPDTRTVCVTATSVVVIYA